MNRTLLKSKIHRATVTDADLEYEGSVTVDRTLMAAANLVPFERVEIYNCTNGERFATYVIPGEWDSGEICINGAAAHRAGRGDIVILASYSEMADEEARAFHPDLVYVDAANRIVSHKSAVA